MVLRDGLLGTCISIACAAALVSCRSTDKERPTAAVATKQHVGSAKREEPGKRSDQQIGLVATYTDLATGRQAAALVAAPNFLLKPGESLHPWIGSTFQAEYNGVLRVLQRGRYSVWPDGGGRLFIDHSELTAKDVELAEGEHALRITYGRNGDKPARLQLMWKSDTFPAEPVPAAALAHRSEPAELAQWQQIEHGRTLAEELNCIACHAAPKELLAGRPAPDLSEAGSRLREAWIYRWLESPRRARPSAVMPAVLNDDRDRRDVAAYLATLKYPLDPGSPEAPDDARAAAAGRKHFEEIGCSACHGKGGVQLEALGSKYQSPLELTRYLQFPFRTDPAGRMPSLMLDRDEAMALADFLFQSRRPDLEHPPTTSGDPRRGQQLVATAGCLNCHTLNAPMTPTAARNTGKKGKRRRPATAPAASRPSFAAPAFQQLHPDRGCLAEPPGGNAARYNLSPDERSALKAFVIESDKGVALTKAPAHELQRSVERFRCTACHELDDARPPEESEHVPPLTLAGDRLRKDWITQVLTNPDRRARPWFHRRMPDFGAENVRAIADQLVAASGTSESEPKLTPTRTQIADGQKLAGKAADGLACITCHGFGGESTGVVDATRGPDLTTLFTRLRHNWFARWLYDPKRIIPNTAMPTFFANKTMDEASPTIESLWAYFSLRDNMPPPTGWIDTQNYKVPVDRDPIVLRSHMPGNASKSIPRGIAVGLPGQLSYCFDADTCALAYAWVGGFLDMKPQWSARGGGQAKLLGRKFYQTSTFPLRIGTLDHEPKPHFEGYELRNGAPTFLYRVDDAEVKQSIAAPDKGTGLILHFELHAPPHNPVYFIPDESQGATYALDRGERTGSAYKIADGDDVEFSVTILTQEGN